MSDHKTRINTLQTMIAGSVIANDPNYTLILGEFREVVNVKRITYKNRYRLLQILHSTRALDSSLRAFITQHRYPLGAARPALGSYLVVLSRNNPPGRMPLPSAAVARFKTSIVNKRNHYMHAAGAFPAHDDEIKKLLSEMQACLFEVLNL
ncbi:MAG: hypothetical protein ACM3QZ_01865 [Solirubrobacterales bacterium]